MPLQQGHKSLFIKFLYVFLYCPCICGSSHFCNSFCVANILDRRYILGYCILIVYVTGQKFQPSMKFFNLGQNFLPSLKFAI